MPEIPTHIGIILDGNRRYAKSLGKSPLKGHAAGLESLKKVLAEARRIGIKEVTIYALSAQNLRRSKQELSALFSLFEKAFAQMISERGSLGEGVKVTFIGERTLLPAKLQDLMAKVEQRTANNSAHLVTIALAYGGREEIVAAVRSLSASGQEISEASISAALWQPREPELIIRTGGEIRTSNFLTWQTIYSEWFFEKKLWPQFTPRDLRRVIKAFQARKRNFGK